MEKLTNEIIKQKITAALNEPSVPQEIVERAVDRINAAAAGKKAEEELARLTGSTSAEQKAELAAMAVTGRLMTGKRPPKNVTAALMTEQLLNNKRFRELTSVEPSAIIRDIRSGELIKKLAQPEAYKTAYAAENAKPDKRPAEPLKGGLSL